MPQKTPRLAIVAQRVPPYGLAREIIERAFELGAMKVAIFFSIARMNAACSCLASLQLAHMYLVTPRPNVPPRAVDNPRGDRVDFIWLILDRCHEGKPTWGWLRCNGSKQCISDQIEGN
jgi:hypothetical protein